MNADDGGNAGANETNSSQVVSIHCVCVLIYWKQPLARVIESPSGPLLAFILSAFWTPWRHSDLQYFALFGQPLNEFTEKGKSKSLLLFSSRRLGTPPCWQKVAIRVTYCQSLSILLFLSSILLKFPFLNLLFSVSLGKNCRLRAIESRFPKWVSLPLFKLHCQLSRFCKQQICSSKFVCRTLQLFRFLSTTPKKKESRKWGKNCVFSLKQSWTDMRSTFA